MISSVKCSNCGAPLNITVGTPYFSCTYCGSQLAIKSSGDGVYYSEVLTRIDKNTGQMAHELQLMRLRQELEHFDAEWHRTNWQFLARKAEIEASLLTLRKQSKQGNGWASSVVVFLLGGLFMFTGLASGSWITTLLVAGLGSAALAASAINMRRLSRVNTQYANLEREQWESAQQHAHAEQVYQYERWQKVQRLQTP